MDWKLPSVSGENRSPEHVEFLQRCYQAGVEVFVKAIISSQTDLTELERAAELVAAVSPEIPVFLQPVTPLEPSQQFDGITVLAPSPKQVLTWQALMKRSLKQVRVVPQTHKMIHQL
jgi:organic radical activating enzyme